MTASCGNCAATTLPLDARGLCLTCATIEALGRPPSDPSSNGDPSVTPALSPSNNRATVQRPDLASEPDILDALARDLIRWGLVGEDRAAKLVYLAAVSRLLPRPVSVVLKGPSSGGKSYTVETVLGFFPDHAYHALTGGSDRSLAYSQEPLQHRMLVIYEAAGVAGDLPSYFLRSLLSEGRLRYETVESTAEGVKARLIEREGPTGVILTTTAVSLHPENETRMLTVPVTDTQEQTRQVLRALTAEDDEDGPDLFRWWRLQEWLEGDEREVTIPYRAQLAELVPPVAVRLRRDFSTLLTLIRAHALLHRGTREADDRGRIVATTDDYAVVRELLLELVSEGVGSTVRPETRDTVGAVAALKAMHENGVPQRAIVAHLGDVDKSAVSRRVRVALDAGYLVNLEERRGRPHRLDLGEPMPDDLEILPSPEALTEGSCTVARLQEGEGVQA